MTSGLVFKRGKYASGRQSEFVRLTHQLEILVAERDKTPNRAGLHGEIFRVAAALRALAEFYEDHEGWIA